MDDAILVALTVEEVQAIGGALGVVAVDVDLFKDRSPEYSDELKGYIDTIKNKLIPALNNDDPLTNKMISDLRHGN